MVVGQCFGPGELWGGGVFVCGVVLFLEHRDWRDFFDGRLLRVYGYCESDLVSGNWDCRVFGMLWVC